jgi:pimeloyl-ACP methyl ester carboxylesterase
VLQREPRRFFAFLDRPAAPGATRILDRRDVPHGEIVVHELATQYEPFHASESWPCCVENARVPFERWRHAGGRAAPSSRSTASRWDGPRIDAQVLMARQWFELGFDVVMPILPFHGPRAPRWARYSGEAFGSWDVSRLNESVRQAVHDVDLIRRWLVADGVETIGMVGLSLGGYLTALMADSAPTSRSRSRSRRRARSGGCRSASSRSAAGAPRATRSPPRSSRPRIACTRRSRSRSRSHASERSSSAGSATASCRRRR